MVPKEKEERIKLAYTFNKRENGEYFELYKDSNGKTKLIGELKNPKSLFKGYHPWNMVEQLIDKALKKYKGTSKIPVNSMYEAYPMIGKAIYDFKELAIMNHLEFKVFQSP